jgi:Protein of unknown function (DUF1353)
MGHDPDNPGIPVDVLGFESSAPLAVTQINAVRWRTTHRVMYRYRTAAGDIITVVVEAGYVTDFSTSPRPFWGIVPKSGQWNPACIVHDRLCDEAKAGRFNRREADRIFRAALADLDKRAAEDGGAEDRVGWLWRWMLWAAVRWGALAAHPRHAADFARDLPVVLPLTVVALPFVLPVAISTWLVQRLIAAVGAIERVVGKSSKSMIRTNRQESRS